MKIKILEVKEIEVTPKTLAAIFWEMDAAQQSYFFDHLINIAGSGLQTQFNAIAHFNQHDSETRDGLQVIGNELVDAE